MINVGQTLEVKIEAYGTNGEGIARYKGNTVFTPFVCVGETAEVKVKFVKGNIINARLVKVISSINGRVKAKCGVFGVCGGCQLQHINYAAQLEFKRQVVVNTLKKIAGIDDVDVGQTIASDKIFGYRNKLQLPISTDNNGKVVVGFYKGNTHIAVPVTTCALQEEWADSVIEAFTTYANECNLTAYNEVTGQGLLRHLVARYVDKQLLLTVVINGTKFPSCDVLIKLLDDKFDKFGLFVNINTRATNVVLSDKTKHVFGLKEICGSSLGIKFKLQTDSFFQINDGVKDKIYSRVKEFLAERDSQVVIDAYSGIGVLTASLTSEKYKTYGIEIVKQAVEDADKIKELNGLGDKMVNICGDAEVELSKLLSANKGLNTAIVVDPPRKGLGSLANTLASSGVNQIAYISCDVATMARDVKILSEAYDLLSIQPYDMFPQTSHVETLALLSRKS